MKALIYLILILVNSVNLEVSYGIDPFLDVLINSGIYDLLYEIKFKFGDLVAIEVCLDLYPTNDCEKVVLVYMPPNVGPLHLMHAKPFNCNLFKDILKNHRLILKKLISSSANEFHFYRKINEYFMKNKIPCHIINMIW